MKVGLLLFEKNHFRRHFNKELAKAQIPLCRLYRDVRDKAVASFLTQIPLRRLPRNFRGSRRNGIWAKGDVTGLSRTCRGRHGKVGIVEFGLN